MARATVHFRPLYSIRDDGYGARGVEWDKALSEHGFLEHRHGSEAIERINPGDFAPVPRYTRVGATITMPHSERTLVLTLKYDEPHGLEQLAADKIGAIPFASNIQSLRIEIRLGPGLAEAGKWIANHQRLKEVFANFRGITDVGVCVTGAKGIPPRGARLGGAQLGGAQRVRRVVWVGLMQARRDGAAACVDYVFESLCIEARPMPTFYFNALLVLDSEVTLHGVGEYVAVEDLRSLGQDQGWNISWEVARNVRDAKETKGHLEYARTLFDGQCRRIARRLEMAEKEQDAAQLQALRVVSERMVRNVSSMRDDLDGIPLP